jgi:Ca2+-binding EF-hand superfamily protein
MRRRLATPQSALALALALNLGSAAAGRAQTTAEQQSYQQRLQQLFQRLDRNGDQRLQRQEVQGQAYLERHFERLDSQRRGYLTPDDLKPVQAQRGERAARFFSQADRNSDGRIDRREAEGYSWLQQHFNSADRNRDGSVDRQELQGLAEQRRRQTSPESRAR